ncbi:Uncharacterized protein TCM_002090 [Theobroma cacao]|uniref:RNase H type-1 domain-containing protein n=1 Tax=Theobroma cacao TaxID=3641 RepID=A0A061DKQ6_THECC|nr:Uncharacterized protein TCM_002090 [Theobroma cacao]
MAWYAINWVIWTTRNDVIFNGKIWDMEQIFEPTKFRVVWLVNAKWPNHNCSIGDLARLLSEGNILTRGRNTKEKMAWTRPVKGSLKFNTNGASKGYLGDSGIGGILPNEQGDVLVLLCKFVGICDSNKTELLVVKKAALIHVASRWCTSRLLPIEYDKRNVIKYITSPTDVPWRLRQLVIQTLNVLCKISKWEIKHILCTTNEKADSLAKEGILRPENFF